MGLFNKMKKFFSCFKYKLDREILREYLQHTINFAVENKLPFCDEFYIADSLDAKDRLHVAILNYDVPGEAVYEIEKSFKGIVIFANHEKCYNPENDHKYINAEDFMTLTIYPWKFTNKVLQLKDVPCFGLRFYNFKFDGLYSA